MPVGEKGSNISNDVAVEDMSAQLVVFARTEGGNYLLT
jgi:hypothetical protein